jgi:glycosyltransferase involved in cell wall biosynthesis
VFIWHGYLLSGTGSNEYTRALARTLARSGHDVTVFSQEADPSAFDLGGASTVRPPLPGRLPVFVLDRYAGMQPALLQDMPRAEVEEFVAANAGSLREHGPADLLIANHVLLGAPVAAASGLPSIVKAHGSELEYSMRGRPELCAWAGETLSAAQAVAAGSAHTGRIVQELTGFGPDRIVVVPPGVATEQMHPRPRGEAFAGLLAQCRVDPPRSGERDPDPDNAQRLGDFLADADRPTVLYVGKLSEEKGVHLLLDAMSGLDARAVIVGFGPARDSLEQQARRLGVDALFTGPLRHRHLQYLWPMADVSVVPSVFPEAFGMVAAEAAACGSPPLVARHSGLAEVAAGLEARLPQRLHILTFEPGDSVDLRRRLEQRLTLSPVDRDELAAGCRNAVVDLWSWDHVARRMLEIGAPSRGAQLQG